jgi:hypothetical protein
MEYFKGYQSDYQRAILEKHLVGFEEKIKNETIKEALVLKETMIKNLSLECESRIMKNYLNEITNDIFKKYFPKEK